MTRYAAFLEARKRAIKSRQLFSVMDKGEGRDFCCIPYLSDLYIANVTEWSEITRFDAKGVQVYVA